MWSPYRESCLPTCRIAMWEGPPTYRHLSTHSRLPPTAASTTTTAGPGAEFGLYPAARLRHQRGQDGIDTAVMKALERMIEKIERSVKRGARTVPATSAYPFKHLPSPFCRRLDAPPGVLCTEHQQNMYVVTSLCAGSL